MMQAVGLTENNYSSTVATAHSDDHVYLHFTEAETVARAAADAGNTAPQLPSLDEETHGQSEVALLVITQQLQLGGLMQDINSAANTGQFLVTNTQDRVTTDTSSDNLLLYASDSMAEWATSALSAIQPSDSKPSNETDFENLVDGNSSLKIRPATAEYDQPQSHNTEAGINNESDDTHVYCEPCETFYTPLNTVTITDAVATFCCPMRKRCPAMGILATVLLISAGVATSAWLSLRLPDKQMATTTVNPQLLDNHTASRASLYRQILSVQHMRDIIIHQMYAKSVDALSISNNGSLIVSTQQSNQLYIVSADGINVTAIGIPPGDAICDAVWTPRGNIAVTTETGEQGDVIILTQAGGLIARNHMMQPQYLSRSNANAEDDIIYLNDIRRGVYQSIDDGATWSLVFSTPDSWRCKHAVRVVSSEDDKAKTRHFVTLEYKLSTWRMRVYTVNDNNANRLTWRNVTMPTGIIDIKLGTSKLGCDNHGNLFLTDLQNRAVHMWSSTSAAGPYVYNRQLLSQHSFSLENTPVCVTLFKQSDRVILYVGLLSYGEVSLFTLLYETG